MLTESEKKYTTAAVENAASTSVARE